MRKIGEHAVVMGGSVSGLLAARVLADAYEQVTIIERDKLPSSPTGKNRRGVPQGQHLHAVLARGAQVLEELFPGISEELSAAGVPRARALTEMQLMFPAGELARGDLGEAWAQPQPSRPLLEETVRARVVAWPGVQVIDNCDVVGLVTDTDHGQVTGVRLMRHMDDSAEEVLDADLMIDAMGRSGRTPAWLTELGFESPNEEHIQVGIGYATRTYRFPPEPFGVDKFISVPARPGKTRGMIMGEQEDKQWMLTLFGMVGDHPPADPDDFLTFAETVAPPEVMTALRDGEPLTDVVTFKFPSSMWRHYERLRRFPAGLLVFGDAICSFNPIYGQGMTVAALQALALRECLESQEKGSLARRFFPAAAKAIGPAWGLAAGGDLSLPEIPGPRPLSLRLLNRYSARVQAAACHDPVAAVAFVRVLALVDPPQRLMSPAMMVRVLLNGIRRRSVQKRAYARP